MREIKFRAWDPVSKKMIFFGLNDIWQNIRFKSHVVNDHIVYSLNGLPIMQLTGRKDDQGQDVWEDDLYLTSIGGKFGGLDVVEIPSIFLLANQIRVIGNIHENPELLKG